MALQQLQNFFTKKKKQIAFLVKLNGTKRYHTSEIFNFEDFELQYILLEDLFFGV